VPVGRLFSSQYLNKQTLVAPAAEVRGKARPVHDGKAGESTGNTRLYDTWLRIVGSWTFPFGETRRKA